MYKRRTIRAGLPSGSERSPTTHHPAVRSRQAHQHEVTFEASRGWRFPDLGEVWTHRDLLFFLILRDTKIRYKQTLIGGAWALLRPVLAMVIFTLLFGRLIGVPTNGIPYAIFVFTGLLPWNFFSIAVPAAAGSLITNIPLISKVYFPRLILPLALGCAPLLDVAVAFIVLLLLMAAYDVSPTPRLLLAPAFLLLTLFSALGIGLWVSALTVKYRDLYLVVPFVMQLWLFATPVIYPGTLIPAHWRTLYAINPMVGAVEGLRWALLATGPAPGLGVLVSALVTIALCVTGLLIFNRMERTFADYL